MFSLVSHILLVILAVTSVNGHGYVQDVVVGSTHYTGYLPYSDPYYNPPPERIIRAIPGNGSAIALNWTTWPVSHVGPMITYLAKAPSDITKWQPGTEYVLHSRVRYSPSQVDHLRAFFSAVWFKIAESGKTADGKWAATDLLTDTNSIYTFTIPPKLQPGQYIIRHEIIALHAAFEYPGAQVYPSCIQIEVTGSGTAFPSSGLVAFPGAYTADTPGIVYDVYTNTSAYPVPGPAVWIGGD
uniref:lytic cellulose monooxygenase (C4-dehydrogenating) n=1 Tax=Ganoderma boninense TaxID=34458 RepID=A0A5K1JYX4_9APHY|nr:Avirulence on Ve1 (Avirulent on Ve1) [Ganoderma boninense]